MVIPEKSDTESFDETTLAEAGGFAAELLLNSGRLVDESRRESQ